MMLTLLACTPEPAITPVAAGQRPPDVIIVTLDTTRADRIGAYGYKDARTETIDKLAGEGIRFDAAYSPLPLTIPSHSTMFTGLLPFHHNIRSNGDNVLAPEFNTVAEQFKAAGYSTAASVAAFVTNRDWGLNQGFSVYYDTLPEDRERNFWHAERSGDLVVNDALSWLEKQPADKPIFLWVHLYDVHYPHQAPAAYNTGKGDSYDAELAFVDDQVERLVRATQDRSVLWALIGDHGESLGEHNEFSHGNQVYNATQHVPWILSGAGVTPGVVSGPVSTADLTPTLLFAAGLPVPDGLDGKVQPGNTQVPYAESYQMTDRYGLAPQRMVVEGGLKLIANPRPELYDLLKDPGEKANLADQRPEDVARLLALLNGLNALPPGKSNQNMDPETLQKLAALGYVAESSWSGEDPFSLPDPKDFTDVLAGLMEMEQGGGGATPDELLKKLAAYSIRLPKAYELKNRQIMLLQRESRKEEARLLMDETARLFPNQPRIFLALAQSVMEEDINEAIRFCEAALAVDPLNATSQELYVQLLDRAGQTDRAIAVGVDYMEKNHRNFGVAAQLGRMFLVRNQLPDAERYLRVAVSATNPRRNARVQLAILARLAKVRSDAYILLNDEIKEYPGNIMARRLIAQMYGEESRWVEQVEHLEAIARMQPEDVGSQVAWAQALFNTTDYKATRRVLDRVLEQFPEEPDVLLLHANLLAKEGKRDEGYQIFLRADALNTARARERELREGKVSP